MPQPVSSSSSRKLRRFCKWMTTHGIRYSDALDFTVEDGIVSDLGVKALCNLHEGDLIASIPKQACITVKTTGAVEMIEEAELGGDLGLAVALMYERSKKERSPWFEYLQLLPPRQTLPIVWGPDEIDNLLVGTELHAVVQEDRKLIQEDWQECISSLSKLNPHDFPAEYFTLEQYFSAKTLVASRAFEVDDHHGYGMVPLADLFNHKTAAEDVHFTSILSDSESDVEDSDSLKRHKILDSDIILEEKADCPIASRRAGKIMKPERGESFGLKESCSSSESCDGSSDVLEMILVKDVSSGFEIFNTYGYLSNAALLHRYGFTELGNPYDIVNVDFTLVLEYCLQLFSKRHVRSRVRLWRRSGCTACKTQGCEYFEISVCGKPQIELLFLLYIVHLSDDAFERLDFSLNDTGGGVENCALALGWTDEIVSEALLNRSSSSPRTEELKARPSKGRQQRDEAVADLKVESWAENLQDCLLTRQVCEGLLWLCNRREKLYGTSSLEEDQELVQNVSPTQQPKLFHALSLRVSERCILRRLQKQVSDRFRGTKKLYCKKTQL